MVASVNDQFALQTTSYDLIPLVELPVVGSDLQAYDRNECKSSTLRYLPLPAEIREYCDLIRSTKPVTGCFDSWVEFDRSRLPKGSCPTTLSHQVAISFIRQRRTSQ